MQSGVALRQPCRGILSEVADVSPNRKGGLELSNCFAMQGIRFARDSGSPPFSCIPCRSNRREAPDTPYFGASLPLIANSALE